MNQIYGRLDPLYDAIRERAPQVDAARVYRPDGSPSLFLRVRYRQNKPRRIVWDDALGAYRWDDGPDDGAQLGRDVDQAADRIAWALGATRGGGR